MTVYLRPEPAPAILINGGFKDVYLTTKTGNDGRFAFEGERYSTLMVKVTKEGFRGAAMFQPAIDQANFTLDKDQTARDLVLHLSRPGAITGRVVDEETRKPVARVKLAAYQVNYLGGHRSFLPGGGPLETDAAGQFTLGGLSATDYVVAVRPGSPEDGRILTRFQPAEFEVIDHDFERTWWPGGHDQDVAVPVPVGSGQTFDIGQIAVRKAPLCRVKATLSSASCAPGEQVHVGLVVRSGLFTSQSNSTPVPCGEPFLITRLAPGSYWIEARSDKRTAESVERASLPFVIEDKNIEVKSVLARGVDIDLRIVPDEGSRKADWSGVRLLLHPRGRAPYLPEIPGSPDREGRLRLVNVEARDYDLRFSDLPPGFYISEVRYNGAVMPFSTLTVNGSAMAHRIEVAVDDKPAAVAGETRPGSRVVLARWPINTPDPRSCLLTTDAGEDGKYQFSNLAPVEYRLFAIAAEAVPQLERPGVLDRMLLSARRLTLAPNAVLTEHLDPLE